MLKTGLCPLFHLGATNEFHQPADRRDLRPRACQLLGAAEDAVQDHRDEVVGPVITPVVIAEDDDDIADILVEALSADGTLEPVVVSNGALVVDALMRVGARLLVLDVHMPGASGIDVYDLVRDHPAFRDIPVLFVTANPELALDTLPGAAPRDIVAKPFDLDDLVSRARSLLGQALAA